MVSGHVSCLHAKLHIFTALVTTPILSGFLHSYIFISPREVSRTPSCKTSHSRLHYGAATFFIFKPCEVMLIMHLNPPPLLLGFLSFFQPQRSTLLHRKNQATSFKSPCTYKLFTLLHQSPNLALYASIKGQSLE